MTIILMLLLAFSVSCQKAETKDEEMTRLLVGTWVREGIFRHNRETYRADGTYNFQVLGTGDQGKGKSPFERRIRHAVRGLDGGAWYWSKRNRSGGWWWIKNGRLCFSVKHASRDQNHRPVDFSFAISELTATRLVTTSEGCRFVFIRAKHWESMTDAEIRAYHKDDEDYKSLLKQKATTSDKDAATHLRLGNLESDGKRYKEAIAEYKKAIAIKPNDALAYYEMGVAYHNLEQYKEAIAAWKKCIAIDPTSLLQDAVSGNIKHCEDKLKIAEYKKAIAIKPNDALAYYEMGSTYHLDLEQYKDAIVAFKKATAIKPDYALAYFWMGRGYHLLKQYPEAIAAYQKYIALEPAGEHADSARRAIIDLSNRDKP